MEDIDPPREQPGASEEIIRGLEAYGFEWDGPVTYQSASREAHEAAIQVLVDAGRAYPCGCSRRALADAPRGPLGIIYPGNCRSGCDADEFALRVRTDDEPVRFDDRLQGSQSQNLEAESGDFIILRRDGLIAYQLAVVVDDELQGITDVVRGIDLMDSTHGAPPIPLDDPEDYLFASLEMLGQRPPPELKTATLSDLWQWSAENWDIRVLEGKVDIPTPENRLR